LFWELAVNSSSLGNNVGVVVGRLGIPQGNRG
jgi:hypothetical protein